MDHVPKDSSEEETLAFLIRVFRAAERPLGCVLVAIQAAENLSSEEQLATNVKVESTSRRYRQV